ncbi:MAG: TetR/AcrR family transcriptional regulator [Pseudomonadota bacterium]
MQLPRKKAYHHGDLKTAILIAAEAELVAHGLESFSLRRVAKAIGVTPAAPSHHFGNTNGLLTELAALGFRRLLAEQKDRQDRVAHDALGQLVASGIGYIDFAVNNPNLFQLMFNWRNLNEDHETLVAHRQAAYDHLVSNVEATQPDAHQSARRALVDAMAAWVTVHGIASLLSSGKTNRLAELQKRSGTDRDSLFGELIVKAVGASHF